MEQFIQLILSGVLVGGIYAAMAMGFVLIFKATGVINFAVGEIVMLGAFFALVFTSIEILPIWVAIALTLGVTMVLGMGIERIFLRPLIGQPVMSSVMMTIALSSFLASIGILIWGYTTAALPTIVPEGSVSVAGTNLSYEHIFGFTIAMVSVGVLTYVFQRTKIGLRMRASAEEHFVAQSVGIDVKKIFGLIWGLSALVCAVSGIVLGNLYGVSAGLAVVGLKVLPIVILGGMDSILGCIVAGILIGVLENFVALYIDPLVGGGMVEVFPFIVMIVILIFKPTGLFGTKRIERV